MQFILHVFVIKNKKKETGRKNREKRKKKKNLNLKELIKQAPQRNFPEKKKLPICNLNFLFFLPFRSSKVKLDSVKGSRICKV